MYVDHQGEQPPARGMDDPTCRDVPADGRRGVPAQLSRGAHPRPRPMFQNRWNVPITLRAKSSRKRNTPPPNTCRICQPSGETYLFHFYHYLNALYLLCSRRCSSRGCCRRPVGNFLDESIALLLSFTFTNQKNLHKTQVTSKQS